MAFFNRETIMPQVVDTYGPYQNLTGTLDQAYDTAQNRASQRINQMYANVGMKSTGAPATAARARSATDIENQRAQQQYQSYYDWLKGKQLATPQIQPSGLSTLAAPFVAGIAQAASPGIVNAGARGLGTAWDWMTGSTPDYSPTISTMGAPSYGEGGYGEYAPDAYSGVSSGFDYAPADVYGEIPSVWEGVNPSDLFDTGFIGW